jgi:hypothetical protein
MAFKLRVCIPNVPQTRTALKLTFGFSRSYALTLLRSYALQLVRMRRELAMSHLDVESRKRSQYKIRNQAQRYTHPQMSRISGKEVRSGH